MSRRGFGGVVAVLLVLLLVSTGTWVVAGRSGASATARLTQQTAFTEARAALLRGDCTAALALLAGSSGPDPATTRQVEEDQSTCRRYRAVSGLIRAGRPPGEVVPALVDLVPSLTPLLADKARSAARKQVQRPGALGSPQTCRRLPDLRRTGILPAGRRDPATLQALGTCWSTLRRVDPTAAESARKALLTEVTRGPVIPTDRPDIAAGSGSTTRFRLTNLSSRPQLITFVGASTVTQFRLPACPAGCRARCTPEASAPRSTVRLARGRYTVLMQVAGSAGVLGANATPVRGEWTLTPGEVGVCLTLA